MYTFDNARGLQASKILYYKGKQDLLVYQISIAFLLALRQKKERSITGTHSKLKNAIQFFVNTAA